MNTPLRVLIVEDSIDDAELMLHELRRGGYEPIALRVESETEMGDALRQDWDVVLADYRLPHFGATAALALLKKTGRDVPFLIVSGSIGEETAVQAMHAGANDYIMKDNASRLVPAIDRELRAAAGRHARRRAEQALRESELRYRTLVEHTSDIIIMARGDGSIVYVSPSVERILGHSSEELTRGNSFDLIHPDDRPHLAEVLQRTLGNEAVGTAEFRCRHRDGSYRVLELVSATPASHDGQPTMLGAVRDVTDRRQLEAQLQQSQKMEAIGRLAGGVAHDFNNLLTVITGYSELISARTKYDEELREEVGEIRKAADRAAALTRQLLAFSRRQVLAPRLVDLNEVVTNMQGLLRPVIGEDVEFHTRLESDLGTVRADPNQIEQVVMNLIVNSRDAMERGGKLILSTANVDAAQAFAQHLSLPPGDYVMLAVIDTGHGMDEETRAHIFEPFFTTKEQGRGTGLGLPTVYGIVRQSGGSIGVQSEPGQGTTFRIYLPRVDQRPERTTIGPPGPAPGGTETVLLVEDEDQVRSLAREVLEQRGYRVLEARHGEHALEVQAAHQGDIEIMVTDMVMPGMSGRELAEQLAPALPGMKVLYVSGYTEDGIVRHGELDAGTAFLQKPFTPDVLARKVREVLGAPRLRAGSSRG